MVSYIETLVSSNDCLMSFSYTEYKPFHESLPTPVRKTGKERRRRRMLRKPEDSRNVTENESKLDSK